jgi:AraC family L-rhamnose operon transcriptional activator RhaR
VDGGLPGAARQRFFELDALHVILRAGSYRAEALYWGVLGQRWWRNYLHAHSFFEACFVYSGSGVFRVNGKQHSVRAGDIFIARPGEMHEIVSSKSRALGIYFWAYSLVPQRDESQRASGGGDPGRSIDSLFEAFARSDCAVAKAVPGIRQTLDLLTSEVSLRLPGFTQAIACLATKLVLDSARSVVQGIPGEEVESAPRGSSQSVAKTAIRYLRDNYPRPIEVRDVAAQVHLSVRHLARLFQQETGLGILEYLTNLRVEAASQLLLDRSLSIKQVARAVGYPDSHYFTTLFGRRTGLTPAVFREKRGTRFIDESRRPE